MRRCTYGHSHRNPEGPTPELHQLKPSLFQTGRGGGTSTAAPESLTLPTQVRRQQRGARFTCLHPLGTSHRAEATAAYVLTLMPTQREGGRRGQGGGGAGCAQKSSTKYQQNSAAH